MKAAAIGLSPRGLQWAWFTIAGAIAGVAGALYAFSKGSISPDVMAIPRSVDALVMVLLGGINTLLGPIIRGGRVYLAAGHVGPLDRVLARGARGHDPAAGGVVSTRHCRNDCGVAVAEGRSVTLVNTDSGQAALQVRALAKSFGGVRAVRGVDFCGACGRGGFALIGPNGAGKTTTFNLINGQIRPDQGEVRLDGRDITGMPPQRLFRQGVARTFQITATFGSMTVRENVQMARMSHLRALTSLRHALGRRADRAEITHAYSLIAEQGLAEQANRPASELALRRSQAAGAGHGLCQRSPPVVDG